MFVLAFWLKSMSLWYTLWFFSMKTILLLIPFSIQRILLLYCFKLLWPGRAVSFALVVIFPVILSIILKFSYHKKSYFLKFGWYCHDNHKILSLTFAVNHEKGRRMQVGQYRNRVSIVFHGWRSVDHSLNALVWWLNGSVSSSSKSINLPYPILSPEFGLMIPFLVS